MARPNYAFYSDAPVAGAPGVPSGCALGAGKRGRWTSQEDVGDP